MYSTGYVSIFNFLEFRTTRMESLMVTLIVEEPDTVPDKEYAEILCLSKCSPKDFLLGKTDL